MQIRELFKLYLHGLNFCQIERTFDKMGYKHKYGKWNRTLVRNAMVNKIYKGYVKYNEDYHKGEHEPIVDEQTFDNANKLYESRDFSKFKNNGRSTYLGGLLFCECCTARYTLSKNGKYRYYICHSRRKQTRHMVKDPNCKNKIYKVELLDNTILEEIKKLSIDSSQIQKIQTSNISDEIKQKETLLQKEISKLNDKKSRFMDLYGIGQFTMEELNDKIIPINEQIEKLKIELSGLNVKRSMSEKEVIEIVSNFEDIINRGKIEEIRLMIASLIDRIEINEDNINIFWRFA
jgi:site-specific DNA recombinase